MAECTVTIFTDINGCRWGAPIPPPLQVEHVRPSSRLTMIDGSARLQRAARKHRVFEWETAGDPDALTFVAAAEDGTIGLPVVWHDPWADQINMLPPELASPGTAPNLPYIDPADDITVTGPIDLDGDRCANVSISPSVSRVELPWSTDGLVRMIPVVEGESYTFAGWFQGIDTVTLLTRWFDANGTALGGAGVVFMGDGRHINTRTAPTGAVWATVQLSNWETTIQRLELDGTANTRASATIVPPDFDDRIAVEWAGTITDPADPRPQTLAGQWQAVDNHSWALQWDGTVGSFILAATADGVLANLEVDVRPAFVPPGLPFAVRVERHFNGNVRWLLADNPTAPPGEKIWTSIGTGTLDLPSIYENAVPMEIGAHDADQELLEGTVRDVVVYHRPSTAAEIRANPVFTGDPWQPGDDNLISRDDAAGNTWSLDGAAIIGTVATDGGGRAGGFQFTRTDAAVGWQPGMGQPRLAVAGATEERPFLDPDCGRSVRSLTVELVEVD